MSVVESKRKSGDLTVITNAVEFAKYTIQICSNNENFPKRYRWCILNQITQEAINLNAHLRKANDVYINKDQAPELLKKDYELRKHYQNQALHSIESLVGMMDIVFEVCNVPLKRREYWTQLLLNVKVPLKSWIKSEKEKYSQQ